MIAPKLIVLGDGKVTARVHPDGSVHVHGWLDAAQVRQILDYLSANHSEVPHGQHDPEVTQG